MRGRRKREKDTQVQIYIDISQKQIKGMNLRGGEMGSTFQASHKYLFHNANTMNK